MILDWLKKVFGLVSKEPTYEDKDANIITTSKSPYQRLDDRIKTAKEEKEKLKSSDTDWYRLSIPKSEERKPLKIFHPRKFEVTINLKALKEERLRREAHELKAYEDEVKSLLYEVERQIGQRNADDTKITLALILEKIVKTKDVEIRQRYQLLQSRFNNLVLELEREELARQAEVKRRKEEEIRKRIEAEEKARKENEKHEKEKREQREIKAKRLVEEARRKEQAEQQERQRLEQLSSELKDDWQSFKEVLDDNHVRYLYHFTDSRNIPSIKRHGGLFSWQYCHAHGITIPCQGGDYDSQELDKMYGLEDYVRLSFCDDHPMAYRLKLSGSNIVILKIKTDVVLLKDTQFSDINAADKRHTHGKSLKHLQMVDFNATRMHYLRSDNPYFKSHQAEVMVKTFIPLKYIVNL